jgi:nucleotide-binding universal stress UspA family protein
MILMNSYENPKGAAGVMMSLEEIMAKDSERELEMELEEMVIRFPKANIRTISRYGVFENCVERTVREEEVDYVVMGIFGGSPFKNAMMGSNTKKAIERTSVPIIAVPKDYEYKKMTKMVVATDLSKVDKIDILQPAIDIASHANAEIHIVYVTKDASKVDIEKEASEMPSYNYWKNYNVKYAVVEDEKIARGLGEYVKSVNADIIVTIPRAVSFWEGLFKKSVTSRMAYRAEYPLLALKIREEE